MRKPIKIDSRHIRWGWGESLDNPESGRYHVVVVDDRDRGGTMNRICEQLSITGPVEVIRTVEGKVKGSRMRYLFQTFDSRTSPEMLNLTKLGKPVRRDKDLRERKVGTIEEYVARIYE